MSGFEFLFSFYSLLLGLAVANVATGFADIWRGLKGHGGRNSHRVIGHSRDALHMTNISHLRIAFVPALFLAVFLPGSISAKRIAPAAVEPVIHEGVRYVVPNDDGRRAYIEAWDVRTNKKLWDLTVFTNRIDPKLEEDVQWVFINTLSIRDHTLIVTSERGRPTRLIYRRKRLPSSKPRGLRHRM